MNTHTSGTQETEIGFGELPLELQEWAYANEPLTKDGWGFIQWSWDQWDYDPSESWPGVPYGDAEAPSADEDRDLDTVFIGELEVPSELQKKHRKFFLDIIEQEAINPS